MKAFATHFDLCIPYIGTKFRGFGEKVFRGVLFPQF